MHRFLRVAPALLLALVIASVIGFTYCGTSSSSSSTSTPTPPTNPTPTPTPPPAPTPNPTPALAIVTYHNDNQRTAQNLGETTLTTANVNSNTFGKVANFPVDGKVDAQPLYLSSLTIGGQAHNVLYAVTEHDSVYAFDADSGTQLWKVSTVAAGETTSDNHGCNQISPEIGITSTPVVDRQRNTIYVVAMSKDSSGKYHQRIHALDLTSGAELFGGPKEITASYPGTGANSSGGNVVFDPARYAERAALLLLNNVIYLSWTSHCDQDPYTGWLMGYDAGTLNQVSVLNLTPNGSEGSIWMSGAGLAADTSGNIYFLDANGTFDRTLDANGFPSKSDFGNSFLKIATSPKLSVADYFATFDTIAQSSVDRDLGSGGVIVLPDQTDASGQTRHLALGAGKDSNIYVVDRDSMGKFNSSKNNIYQQVSSLAGGVFSAPAYYNGTVYFGAVGDHLKAYQLSNAKLPGSPTSQSANAFTYPGTSPSISANGTSNGIVWAVENGSTAALHAYDALNLAQELYSSKQNASRDSLGPGNKFITPMIANGRVFVGTTNSVAVYGLL